MEQRVHMPVEAVFAGKSIFLTGGTGFFGKVEPQRAAVLEKLLRSAPDVEQIFVLIRARKGVSAAARLEKEIIASRIFDRLRRERDDCDAFLRRKLRAVAGDVTMASLGLSEDDQRLLRERVEITIHSAATVQFNEPLEVAVEMNCMGALNMAQFVKTCPRVRCHLHVSTAYVNSNLRVLRIREELYPLDFNVEDALDAVTKASPSDLERLHVNLIGTYPNTYALTKSMAEHLITKLIGDTVPLVIFRPTIIGAAWKEPVPGWTDQIAAAGAIFLAVGMGVLTMLPGDPRNVADIVPVDLAVNNLLVSIAVTLDQQQQRGLPRRQPTVVHSGTSDPRQNPLRWRVPCRVVPEYFRQNPPARGLFPAKFHMIPTPQQFQLEWFAAYALPSSVYSTLANKSGNARHMRDAAKLWTLTWRARNLVEAFKPFTENQWVFVADAAMDSLLPRVQHEPTWWVDAREIAWERYVFNFCVGLKKFMLHEDVIDVDVDGVTHTELALSTGRILAWDPDHHAISFPGLLSDVSWAYTSSRKPGYTRSGVLGRVMGLTGWREGQNHEASHVPRRHIDSIASVRNEVLESEAVRAAIASVAADSGRAAADVEAEALRVLDTMAAQVDYKSVRKLAWLLRKLFRRMYERIDVDEKGLLAVRELLRDGRGSVVLVPTHRSYVDFLLISYLFFAYNMPVPYIAAGNDFLQLGAVTKLLRESGAYFIRRSFRDDALYAAYLLTKGHTVEFFIEGQRSRSGKQLPPKFGILSAVVDCWRSGRVENVGARSVVSFASLSLSRSLGSQLHIVPVTIDYEKPLEVLLHQNEVLGEGKIKESLGALLRSWHVTRRNFGSISVQFAAPISVRDYVAAQTQTQHEPEPHALVRDLAFEVTAAMIAAATCSTSHLVATLLLVYRQGIARAELVQQTNWLRLEVLKRGGRVTGTQGRSPADTVEHALELLAELVVRRRKDLVEPAIVTREQYPNMIGLGYYRNKLLHWFSLEGVLACAFHALAEASMPPPSEGVAVPELLDAALFLHDMLLHEFVRRDCAQDRAQLQQALERMRSQRVLLATGDASVAVGPDGRPLFSLLCTLLWPFVDSYYVAISSLFALRPHATIRADDLLKRIQWLAETMYHERLISFYESCSLETLQNALAMLERWQVIERFAEPVKSKRKARIGKSAPPDMIRLHPQYASEDALETLALRVARFRKMPRDGAVHSSSSGPSTTHVSHLIAQLPTLSKM
ncbi:hypothetical protein ATCC90586_010871 [Pythium insidiosum]|nr:hypothetical protein ATCC90586_010871 [Pythium insidiosum]